jgi:hypothetical protein
MFVCTPGSELSSITVVIEEPGGEKLSLILSYKGDTLESFPVFLNSGAGQTDGQPAEDSPREGKLVQGKAQRNADGTPRMISYTLPELSGGAPGEPGGEDMEAEILEGDEESRPLLVRVRQGDAYSFVVLRYSQDIAETWFDGEGKPLFAITLDKDGKGGEYHYNNQGLISGIQFPIGTWSAVYTADGLPRYVHRQFPASAEPEVSGESQTAYERYTLQWDEAGRLVRLSGGPGEIPLMDCRYSYTLDSRGNWVERREIRMINQGERLFPSPGLTVKRTIDYAK